MIDDLKPYPAMKDSGVPWLGEVPEHWGVKRIKHIAGLNPSKSEANAALVSDAQVSFLPMECVGTDGRVEGREMRAASTVWNGFTYFRRDDVLVAKITPCFENGKGACLGTLPSAVGFGSTEFIVLRGREAVLPDFLYRITTLSEFRTQGADAMTGAAGQQRVPTTFVSNFQSAIPAHTEQAAIVRFLDLADQRIRRYARAKRKLIRLLEEQKQAVIHQAVTRGLDPDVPVKNSGLKWLGDVPTHWDVRRNGRLFVQRNHTGFAELPILEVSLRTGVRVREFESSARKQVMSDRNKYKRAEKGDIAYNMMRMWQGAVGVAPVDGLISPAYVVASPLDGVDPRYFTSLFRTAAYLGEIDNHSHGIVKDRNRLYWEDFKQIFSPYPPPQEQVVIADFVQSYTTSIGNLIDQAKREIELLNEYRTRLIADVVTGKLDVRAAAAALPDEGNEPDLPDDTDAEDEDDVEMNDDVSAEADV